jgi:hypothetical protein
MSDDALYEVAYGHDRDAVQRAVREWFGARGLDPETVDPRLVRFEVGRDLDGRDYWRCRVSVVLLDAGGQLD